MKLPFWPAKPDPPRVADASHNDEVVELLSEMYIRLKRMETRLCKLMEHSGVSTQPDAPRIIAHRVREEQAREADS